MTEPSRYPLPFKANLKPLTLGMEMELQVLDRETHLLIPKAKEVIAGSGLQQLTSEFFQSTLECVSGVCHDVQELEQDFKTLYQKLIAYGAAHGLVFVASGTHPLADYRDRLITPSPRYFRLVERNQWLARRRAVYGLHIHLGMVTGDACIRFANFFSHFIPHFIALAASSPFWQKINTGLACTRSTIFESMPSAGLPAPARNWKHFLQMYQAMRKSKTIRSFKDISWDIRPSPRHGTLELRMCDATSLQEALAIVSLVHCLGFWFQEHEDQWNAKPRLLEPWVIRENKWRAIRFGTQANLIVSARGGTRELREEVWSWLAKLRPYFKRFGYDQYQQHLIELLEYGGSSIRQKAVFERTGSLQAVVANQLTEFENMKPMQSVV